MVCSYCYSCLDLPVVLVDCQVEGCPLRLHNVCQGGYWVLNYIDFEGREQKFFWCVGGVQVIEIEECGIHNYVHDKLIRRVLIRSGGESACGVVVMRSVQCLLFTLRRPISVSSIVYFSSFGSYSEPFHPSIPLYLGALHIEDYF